MFFYAIKRLRTSAIENIKIMKNKLVDSSKDEKKNAKNWFKKLGIENDISQIDFEFNANQETKKKFKIQIGVEMPSLDLFIQENQILKSLKNLHNYTKVLSYILN